MLQNKLQIAKDALALLPAKGLVPPEQDEYQKFGNWTGQTDNKIMAKDLLKRGLIGANQLIEDNPNTSSAAGMRNAQSDWKIAAIQEILANAKRRNLRTPEEINANRDVLAGKWKDAISNSSFQHIHPNWWDVINHSILPEQYAKYDKMNEADNIAKK